MAQTKAQLIDGKGDVDLGALSISGSAPDNSVNLDASGRLLVGTSSTRSFQGFDVGGARLQLESTAYQSSSASFINNQANTDGAYLLLGKSRGTSLGSTTIVSSGDLLGAIWFTGADGSVLQRGAIIEAFVDGTPGANDMPGRLVFSTTADGASSPTERMRITSTGDIYCGNSAQPTLFLGSTTNAGSGTVLSRIVGRSNVYGANTAAINFRGGDSGYADWSVISFDTTGASGTVERLRISSNGTFTGSASNDISDQRLKYNIQSIDNAVDKVKALVGRTFEWKPEASMQPGVKYGFIAQEVENVIPELIEDKTGIRMLDNEGNIVINPDDYNGPLKYAKSVQTSGIVPVLLEALKEAIGRIEALESEVATLKTE